MKKLLVKELIEQFQDCVNLIDGHTNTSNVIRVPGLKRVVFEMLGLFSSQIGSVAILGKREFGFLSQKTLVEQQQILHNLLKLNPPAIILTKSFTDPTVLLQVNQTYQVPILKTDFFSTELSFTVETYINEQFATVAQIHGVLLEVFGVGVLLTGRSGIGKSECALDLINKNHLFVGDDAIEIYRLGNRLFGRAQEVAKKFMEIRGLGIINVERFYGLQITKQRTEIQLIVNLLSLEKQTTVTFERLGTELKKQRLLGVDLSFYEIPISPGRKTSEIIESAVIDFKLKHSGYNSALDFIENQKAILKRKKDES
ncbi:HPr(Ser) kinase/phosphatase [Mycoplasmoides pneumoniae]|uniref:HPr kinase/phosphorylase n=3 Tax=Mycoplasmoides pneumoniae TaxID=2104 RepID=A0AB33HMD9_MYCPM|nr:HPr(Ser) kinase/phosphatase [Mycoplasmoides pneumoniae]ARQ34373.1 HPr kinase/phosphorylase [Mycoplasmoides pneumoniae]ARQ41457.1 HPr kinase/phosphorylase [Mycoplasmoides pneumoniae]ARQ43583.1 HPr kinase/phosphorylase [Mycoplasmoides pneumoniae]QHR07990.1 HPr kinase/phosphorylase [Mycoplasmoides pneumoniae]QHR10092.1 HPr kinase/phosphorylase [Mycoplasmoides pneumoniae]